MRVKTKRLSFHRHAEHFNSHTVSREMPLNASSKEAIGLSADIFF